ncbi:glycosyltransferase family 4 protein [Sulfitobacter sp. S190]|nr:glycosyltransferase family 4 protein [Sulfitobacter sp. S190]
MARALITALEGIADTVTLASRFRSRDGAGVSALQKELRTEADALIPDLVARGRQAGWHAWISYHNYYKAPDLLGPAVAHTLGIPYLLVEATRARKRLNGPWDAFARAAEAASDAARVIFYFTEHDAESLLELAPAHQSVMPLRPFLAREDLPPATNGGDMVTVAMMRPGDKLASYELLADTLALLEGDWRLRIAGDGDARAQVAALMAPFGDRVELLGQCDATTVETLYQNACALLWPGVNEAFGMIYLEAQAYGLPVIAQDRPGVRDVLLPASYPAPEEGAAGLARLASHTLANPPDRDALRAYIYANHLLGSARTALGAGLAQAGVT